MKANDLLDMIGNADDSIMQKLRKEKDLQYRDGANGLQLLRVYAL